MNARDIIRRFAGGTLLLGLMGSATLAQAMPLTSMSGPYGHDMSRPSGVMPAYFRPLPQATRMQQPRANYVRPMAAAAPAVAAPNWQAARAYPSRNPYANGMPLRFRPLPSAVRNSNAQGSAPGANAAAVQSRPYYPAAYPPAAMPSAAMPSAGYPAPYYAMPAQWPSLPAYARQYGWTPAYNPWLAGRFPVAAPVQGIGAPRYSNWAAPYAGAYRAYPTYPGYSPYAGQYPRSAPYPAMAGMPRPWNYAYAYPWPAPRYMAPNWGPQYAWRPDVYAYRRPQAYPPAARPQAAPGNSGYAHGRAPAGWAGPYAMNPMWPGAAGFRPRSPAQSRPQDTAATPSTADAVPAPATVSGNGASPGSLPEAQMQDMPVIQPNYPVGYYRPQDYYPGASF